MDYFSQFEELKSKGLSLDLTRGKPSSDQLDLSNDLANFTNNDFSFDANLANVSITGPSIVKPITSNIPNNG